MSKNLTMIKKKRQIREDGGHTQGRKLMNDGWKMDENRYQPPTSSEKRDKSCMK